MLNGKPDVGRNAVHGDTRKCLLLASDADVVVRIDQSGTYLVLILNFGLDQNGIV